MKIASVNDEEARKEKRQHVKDYIKKSIIEEELSDRAGDKGY